MSWLLSNREKPYIDAAKTDVMRTWRKHGFVPPSESKFNFLTESQDREQRNDHKEVHQVQRNKAAR
jgi:hypothetical protein